MNLEYTQFMHISSREALNALDASHPQLASLYHRMMSSARIFTPPKILLEPLEALGCVYFPSDTIILDPHFVENAPIRHTAAVIGHETGHLLSESCLTYFTPPEILRAEEQQADRIAVHLTGSHDDVSGMRSAANHHVKNIWRPSNKLGLDEASLMGRIARKIDHLHPFQKKKGTKTWQAYLRDYGTPEELEANIRSVDLSDRSHLETLVEKRNKRQLEGRSV